VTGSALGVCLWDAGIGVTLTPAAAAAGEKQGCLFARHPPPRLTALLFESIMRGPGGCGHPKVDPTCVQRVRCSKGSFSGRSPFPPATAGSRFGCPERVVALGPDHTLGFGHNLVFWVEFRVELRAANR
jgi:hypothetical protein